MTKKFPDYTANAAVAADDYGDQPKSLKPQLGSFEVVRIERDFVPMISDDNGTSFGAALDDVIADAVKDGRELQSITVHIIPEQWRVIHKYYGGK